MTPNSYDPADRFGNLYRALHQRDRIAAIRSAIVGFAIIFAAFTIAGGLAVALAYYAAQIGGGA